ncbi:MAG TPA: hypothetical protein VFR78_14245 [Pyrinomonadaceae bacterium]|nr:hypothetical protein [Pyrinomonadaceae bacterium]
MSSGCKQCGARAVGEPLPKPAHELPSYGRALVLAAGGAFVVLVFLVQTTLAYVQRSESFGFWTIVAAAETAAWQLKWLSIPVFLVASVFGTRLYSSIRLQPERFCGMQQARGGLIATLTVTLLIALLIGVTVPERLRHRQLAKEATIRSQWYTFERAMFEYKLKYQSYPADYKLLLERMPDPDGTLASLDPSGYKPSADVAVVTTEPKSRSLRGAVIRNASIPTEDTTPEGLAFTNYVMRFPGEDKILNTDDDWIGRDGVIMKVSEAAKGGVGHSVSAGALQP